MNRTSVASAITISGMMTETNVSASKNSRRRLPTRCRPSAAMVPKIVARIALTNAIWRLLSSAFCTVWSASARWYHLRLNPSQSVTYRWVPLKLKITTITIGRNRNT